MIYHHVQRIQRQATTPTRLVGAAVPAPPRPFPVQQRGPFVWRRQSAGSVARLTRHLPENTITNCYPAMLSSGSRPVKAFVSGHLTAHITSPRSFSSTSATLTENDQTQPSIAIPKNLGPKMFRHDIGPDGRVRGMRSLLGEEARGDEVVVNDQPLPIFLNGDFMAFVAGNSKLPNNRTSTIPPLTREEFQLLRRPYREWAPAPFNNTLTPLDSAVNLFMFSTGFSGFPDLSDLESLLSSPFEGLSFMEQEAHFNKMRAWGGLVPLSDRRWKEKGLDQPDNTPGGPPRNFLKAMDHLEKTDSFMYWNIDSITDKLRKSYNKAYDRLAHFDNALAAYYAEDPSRRPSTEQQQQQQQGKAADLWAEYFFSHVQFMTARAHTWYTENISALQNTIVQELTSAPVIDGGRVPSAEQDQAMRKLEQIIQHRSKADYTLLIPLTGFKNNLPHWQHLNSPPVVDWTMDYLNSGGSCPLPGPNFPQDPIMRDKVYGARKQYLLKQKIEASQNAPGFGTWMTEGMVFIATQGREVMDLARDELRGGPPVEITEELWITRLRGILEQPARSPSSSPSTAQPRNFTKWGWVAYRLDYSHTPEEWSRFLDAFNADVLASWEEGVKGASHVKPKCHIQWLDGRDFGIPENDANAARAHLQSLKDSKSPLLQGLLTPDAFLVADKQSIDSYLHPPEQLPSELIDLQQDLKPFICVSQTAKFDPADSQDRNKYEKEAPGYLGCLDIAGCVLMDDVWPSLFMRLHGGLHSFWPIAAVHPARVYLGPYAKYQEHLWGQFDQMMREVMEAALQGQGQSQGQGQGGGSQTAR